MGLDRHLAMAVTAGWVVGMIWFLILGVHFRMRELLKLKLSYQESRALDVYNQSTDHGTAEDGRWIIRAGDVDHCPTVLPYIWSKTPMSIFCAPCRWILRFFLCKTTCPNPLCCADSSPKRKTIEDAVLAEMSPGVISPDDL